MEQHQLISLLIVAVLVVAYVWYKRRPTTKYFPDLSGDASVVANLREIGSNMDVPHLMEFFFYFPTQEGAESVATALAEDGFEVQSLEATSDQQWSLVVTKRMLPDAEELEKLREEFELLVEPVQGEYDGFGAGIEQ